jgi:hypothetical protein
VRLHVSPDRALSPLTPRDSCFQSGDYVGADKFYTQAIIKDPTSVFQLPPYRASLMGQECRFLYEPCPCARQDGAMGCCGRRLREGH